MTYYEARKLIHDDGILCIIKDENREMYGIRNSLETIRSITLMNYESLKIEGCWISHLNLNDWDVNIDTLTLKQPKPKVKLTIE